MLLELEKTPDQTIVVAPAAAASKAATAHLDLALNASPLPLVSDRPVRPPL
jgi:hypothetical protein